MKELEGRRVAVAFWTLLGAVVMTVLATVTGNLMPAALSLDTRDALGYVALGLIAAAHALTLAAGLTRLARPPVSLRLAGERA
jgi:hypothetical protein